MDEADHRVVESLSCVRCGGSCQVARAGDLLVFACPQDGTRHVLTVQAPTEVAVERADDLLTGKTLGPCRIVKLVGWEGGVPLYQGLDVALDQPHAVRVLRGEPARDKARLQGFVRAGRLAAAVRHAALASVTHLGRLDEGLFAVAPALEGRPLDAAGRLGLGVALHVGTRLAEALAALHDRQIVHRNIGPKSVYLLPSGEPLLRNFAFAIGPDSPADPKTVVGQAGYLAPEQAKGGPVDARADLYALGALLYFALSGQPPFSGKDPAETIRSQLAGKLPNRGPLAERAPAEVADLVLGMLALDPARRPGDARAALAALTAAPSVAPHEPVLPSLDLDEARLAIIEPGREPSLAPEPEAPAAATPREAKEPETTPALGEPSLEPQVQRVEKPAQPAPAPELGPQPGGEPEAPAPQQKQLAAKPAPEIQAPDDHGDFLLEDEQGKPGATADGEEVLADVEVEIAEPIWKQRRVLIGAGALAAVVLIVLVLIPLLSPGPSAPRKTSPVARSKAKPKPRPKGKKPTAAERAEAAAKRELAMVRVFAKRNAGRPSLVIKHCEEFLDKYGKTSSAPAVVEIREAVQAALREKAAEAQWRSLARARGQSYPERLKAIDAFLKKHTGTKAAGKAKKLRDDTVKGAELAAARACTAIKTKLEQHLKTNVYGDAIKLLDVVAGTYSYTEKGKAVAAQLARLRQQVATLFAKKKEAAELLVRECAFSEAIAQFDEPLKVWKTPELQKEAEQAIALMRTRRAKVVAAYSGFLAEFEGLVKKCKFQEALAAARAAAKKADEPTMATLAEGKASNAGLLLRTLDRIVAGAKAERAKAAKRDGLMWVRRAAGGGVRAKIEKLSRSSLVLDVPNVPGASGEVSWGELSVDQLVTFARSAPDKPAAADHCAVGLLALLGGQIRLAYQEFDAAVALDEAAVATVAACLRRHSSGFVHIPAGEFLAGKSKGSQYLEGFLLGRYEVTNAEYAFFVRATKATPPPSWKDGRYRRGREEYPVGEITWQEANAYAAWVGMRLPTTLEWERAVRGADGRIYPWGNEFDPRRANLSRATRKRTKKKPPRLQAVTRGSLKDLAFPLYHLCGNVREWTATPPSARGPSAYYYVVGGSAEDGSKEAVAHARERQSKDQRDPFTGFRLAWPR